jgi:2-haloacid dehalogenase
MKYELIIFDADETLFDFIKSERVALEKTIEEFNIEYDENHHLKIYSEINKAIWKEFESGQITQHKLKVERFKRLSSALNIAFDENEFSKAYMRHLGQASFLFDDSIDLIESLHKTHRLSIITNGLTDVQTYRIKKSLIANFFEDIVISEEVHVAKPDPKIFEIALNNLNYSDKNKVLMVGDSLTSDIKGGANFGIDTCWYNPGKLPNTTDLHPTYEIFDLLELKQIVQE